MLVVRPSHPSDLDGLYALAASAAVGLTTLPKDRDMLASYLDDSQHAFERNITQPRGERYLLVMEDVLSMTFVAILLMPVALIMVALIAQLVARKTWLKIIWIIRMMIA